MRTTEMKAMNGVRGCDVLSKRKVYGSADVYISKHFEGTKQGLLVHIIYTSVHGLRGADGPRLDAKL